MVNTYRSASQSSPFTSTPDQNNPSAYYAQQRQNAPGGQPNLQQAISGMPIGGHTLFNGAQQALNGGAALGPQVQPQKQELGAPAQGAQGQSGNNVDRFMTMLQDPQYGSAQAAVDAYNKLGLGADSTGLSSNYGSSPAVYDNGNTIGLPDRYMTKNSDGTWTTTMRSQGGGQSNPSVIQNAIMGAPTATIPGIDTNSIWQQVMQSLQNPQTAQAAKQAGFLAS